MPALESDLSDLLPRSLGRFGSGNVCDIHRPVREAVRLCWPSSVETGYDRAADCTSGPGDKRYVRSALNR